MEMFYFRPLYVRNGIRQLTLTASSPLPIGYVGLGTVGAATWWYLFDDEGPQVTFYQLVSFQALVFYLFQFVSSGAEHALMLGDPGSVQK